MGASYLGEGSYQRVGAALFKQMLHAHFQPQTDSPGNNCFMVCPGIVSSSKEAFGLDILGKCYSHLPGD